MSGGGRTARGPPLFFDVFRESKNRYKNGTPKVTKMVSKMDPKSEPKSVKWAPKALSKEGSKKTSKTNIFSTPECGSSVVKTNKINQNQV